MDTWARNARTLAAWWSVHNRVVVSSTEGQSEGQPIPLIKGNRRGNEQLKAEVLGLLLKGHTVTEVSRALGVPKSTVLYWWKEHGPSEPRSLAQRELLGQQVYDTVKTTLEALAARARLTADEEWIREQSAAAIAHLDAVHWDRVIRLLSALRPTESETDERDLDAESEREA